MTDSIEARIRRFIEDNFLFADDLENFPAESSLLEAGVIDSTGVLELVGFLETDLGVPVADADIVPENLDSIAAIAAFVERKRGLAAAA
ncbi:acyl carrier protein [Prosthecomicrobium sp. N25]|uniref:acyl carrier protein n=1 Tax=Prosthecomicrobium sp. N25 TaxID=3129254 RepID=UPI003076AE23